MTLLRLHFVVKRAVFSECDLTFTFATGDISRPSVSRLSSVCNVRAP